MLAVPASWGRIGSTEPLVENELVAVVSFAVLVSVALLGVAVVSLFR